MAARNQRPFYWTVDARCHPGAYPSPGPLGSPFGWQLTEVHTVSEGNKGDSDRDVFHSTAVWEKSYAILRKMNAANTYYDDYYDYYHHHYHYDYTTTITFIKANGPGDLVVVLVGWPSQHDSKEPNGRKIPLGPLLS